jgi:hypothetical protein
VTEEAWQKGSALLEANLPRRDATKGVQSLRGATYRQELGHLTDDQWEFAVWETIRNEDWFPSIATLLRYASEYEPPVLALPPARRTDEEREQARVDAKRGLDMIRQACKDRGFDIAGEPGKEMPRG